VRVIEVVDPHADTAEAVMLAAQQRRDQLRVLGFAADLRAVFTIERDVEHRAPVAAASQRFQHQLLAAGVVIAGRQDWGGTSPSNSTSAGVRARILGVRSVGNVWFGEIRFGRALPDHRGNCAKRARIRCE
jgi:hypothetical protein